MEEGVCDKKWQEWKNDEEKEAECLDDTSPDKMEEDVSDINGYRNQKNYKEKEAECINDTFTDDMEEGVLIEIITKMKNMMRKKVRWNNRLW